MITSDTLHYRPDGTVSGVTRTETRTFVHPITSKEVSETVTGPVDLSAVTGVLDAAYAANQARHTELEEQIAAERQAAEAEKAAMSASHAEAVSALVAEKEALMAERPK